MKKKIVGMFVCTLLIATILPISGTVIAGDPENPEITDEHNDLFGPLSFASMPYVDIDSGWFQDDAENLYMTLKVVDLSYKWVREIHSIHWTYGGIEYSVGSHTWLFGLFQSGFLTWQDPETNEWMLENITVDACRNSNTITYTAPKALMGNIHAGDVLEDTFAWTGVRTIFEPITYVFFLGEIVKDYAEGSNYIIQY